MTQCLGWTVNEAKRLKRLAKAKQIAKQRQADAEGRKIQDIIDQASLAFADSVSKSYKEFTEKVAGRIDVSVDTESIAEKIEELTTSIAERPDVAQQIKEHLEELIGKIEPRVVQVEKTVPIQSKAPIVNVEKASDDIYARYDWVASSDELDGQYIGYLQQSGAWFIQRIAKGVNGQMSTFTVGKKNFDQAWQSRLKLKYSMRNEVIIP